ncbi:MAG TPA: SWIM zinc finger family protein [Actinomycetota bacterium]|nr:SWIM zinc finger family protein [Actinomycetota bacterium]
MRRQTGGDRRTARGPRGRRGFGRTWWGDAWVTALEERARLDPNRLPRGRTYARRGTVGELTIAAGEVRAAVQGSRARPYQVRVRVRTLEADEWGRVLDAIAAQIGHAAALLDGELLPEVADDVRSAGTDLLPGPGELQPRCTCPDWADPCKHAAAVCYLVADALDADPFALLLLRGRGRDEVLAGLRSRRRPPDTSPARATLPEPATDSGIDAREAYRRSVSSLPMVPLPPQRPGRPAVLPVDPPAGSGLRQQDLVALAADAAARAWELATGAGDGGLSLDLEADLARRAAGLLGSKGLTALAASAGMASRELLRWAIAWRQAGGGGLDALRATWQPAPEDLAEGRAALDRPAGPGAARVWRNRITRGEAQLRFGRDRLWYRFVRSGGDWILDGQPEPEPGALLAQAATTR